MWILLNSMLKSIKRQIVKTSWRHEWFDSINDFHLINLNRRPRRFTIFLRFNCVVKLDHINKLARGSSTVPLKINFIEYSQSPAVTDDTSTASRSRAGPAGRWCLPSSLVRRSSGGWRTAAIPTAPSRRAERKAGSYATLCSRVRPLFWHPREIKVES